ncbi:MAG: hypothetical protein K2X77_32930 [Candidatus Obscuribacterales bacterium]|jgi:hypothetical protein|nr:hypothetical protein [Candidatus Obscuribacterales bacterium]
MILSYLPIFSIVFCFWFSSVCCAPTFSENESQTKRKAVQKAVDLDRPAGDWMSDWGPVSIKQAADGTVTGSWTEGKNKLGRILRGKYDESKRSCSFEFIETWTGKRGSARLALSPDGKKLSGSWVRGKDKGTWEMKR